MTDDLRVFRLLEQVLDLPETERCLFLDQSCGVDVALRQKMAALSTCESFPFLEWPAHRLLSDWGRVLAKGDPPAGETKRIGPYLVLKKRAGTKETSFYHVIQSEPIYRELNLKLFHRHGGDNETAWRMEQQVLGNMNHPNVMRVYDSGRHLGLPFFTMEYFPGKPITDYCRGMDVRGCLELFAQVCAGVGHAHGRGIVHCDLKPANLLVWDQERRPYVKLVGFARARRLGAGILSAPAQNERAESPVDGAPVCWGTGPGFQADIAALGCVLYEILTGEPPLLPQTPLHPARARLGTPVQGRELVRNGKDGYLSSKPRRLKGDLGRIVNKAMARKAATTYVSVAELARDLDHYINLKPTSVGGGGSRLVACFRRHQNTVTLSVLLGLAVLIGASVWRQNHTANRRLRHQAQNLELRCQTIEGFLRQVLRPERPDLSVDLQLNKSLRRNMEVFLDRISRHRDSGRFPRIESNINESLSLAYMSIGHFEKAETLLRRTLIIRETFYGLRHPETVRTLTHSAYGLFRRGRLPEAERAYRHALKIQAETPACPAALILQTRRGLGHVLRRSGRLEKAIALYRETLATQQVSVGSKAFQTLLTARALGMALQEQGELERAEEIFRQVAEIQKRKLGLDHLETLSSLENLGTVLNERGRHEEAEHLFRETYARRKIRQGGDHPNTWRSGTLLSATLLHVAAYDEALALLKSLWAFQRFQPETGASLATRENYALALMRTGSFREAIDHLEALLEIQRHRLGYSHQTSLNVANSLAEALAAAGELVRAETLARQNLAVQEREFGSAVAQSLIIKCTYGEILFKQRRYRKALPLFQAIHDHSGTVLGETHPLVVVFEGWLGLCLAKLDFSERAEVHLLHAYQTLGGRPVSVREDLARALIDLYEKTDPEKAVAWKNRLEEEADPECSPISEEHH